MSELQQQVAGSIDYEIDRDTYDTAVRVWEESPVDDVDVLVGIVGIFGEWEKSMVTEKHPEKDTVGEGNARIIQVASNTGLSPRTVWKAGNVLMLDHMASLWVKDIEDGWIDREEDAELCRIHKKW